MCSRSANSITHGHHEIDDKLLECRRLESAAFIQKLRAKSRIQNGVCRINRLFWCYSLDFKICVAVNRLDLLRFCGAKLVELWKCRKILYVDSRRWILQDI